MPVKTQNTQDTHRDRQASYERLNRLAYWMDERIAIPGTKWRIGLDALIGLVPGVGDVITSALSAYVISEARRLGAPRHLMWRMAWNIGLDTLLGSVPLVGDIFDVAWKANRKNVTLLMRHLERDAEQPVVAKPPAKTAEDLRRAG